jgi:hypothetical protein
VTGPTRPLALLVLAAVAAATAYVGTLGHGFVYDDHRFVGANPGIDAVAAAPWRAFDPSTASVDGAEPGMWRPVRTLSFALDRALFGRDPAGMHLANVLLHGVATALVFALGSALRIGDLGAAAGAAIFALHPVQAEAVSWVSARGDLLSAALLLAATTAHVRRAPAALVAGFAGLAFLAKESAVAAPLLFAAADLAAGGTALLRERRRSYLAAAAGIGALVVLRAAVLAGAGTTAGQGAGMGLGGPALLLAQPALFAWYAGRVLLPSPGTFDHQVEPGALLGVAGAALAVLLVSWERFRLPRSAAGPIRCGALWALAALAPVTILQVVFPLKILAADRFLYLALAGPALALGALAGARGPAVARGLLVAAPALLFATFPASARWASDESLWGDTLARDPGHARAFYGLAAAKEVSAPAEARRLYAAYLETVKGDAGAWFRLGMTEERLALAAESLPPEQRAANRRGHLVGAAVALDRAIRLWTAGEVEGRARGLVEARLALATVLAGLGRDGEAETEAEEAFLLWAGLPEPRRTPLEPRLGVLRRWAREKGRTALLGVLEGRPPAARQDGPGKEPR